MKLLIIGGTAFVGRAIAAEALERGHDVTLFHRGNSSAVGLDGARELLGDRDGDLSALAVGEWDATIDVCAYRPGQVESLARALAGRGGHHVFVSTVSVYADDIPADSDESATQAPLDALTGLDLAMCDITNEAYGPLKVLCEQAVDAGYRQPLMIRPTYVIGPYDHTDRFPHWVRVCAAGGTVEAPDSPDTVFQYVDARDLAAFTVSLTERRESGAFHVAAPAIPFVEMVRVVAEAVGAEDLTVRWVPAADEDAESSRFPLWTGNRAETVLQVDASAARSAGLVTRPLAASARDTLAWLGA